MPFSPPWARPQKGDLMYGLHSDFGRTWYIKHVKEFIGKVTTIDSFGVLADDPRSTHTSDQEFLEFVAQHQKYQSAVSSKSTNEAVRRKCKAGLDWAASKGKTVHFALDNLDLNAVIHKATKGGNPDRTATDTSPKNRAITGAELRWIYRNRYRQDVQQCIQFWVEGAPCPPPWQADVTMTSPMGKRGALNATRVTYAHGEWSRYHPHTEHGAPATFLSTPNKHVNNNNNYN